MGVFLGELIDESPEFVFGTVLGAIFGLAFGTAQWRVLRPHLAPVTSWIWGTLAGFVLAAMVIFGLMAGGDDGTSMVTKLGHGLILGATLGVGQWLAIRGKVKTAVWWVPVSVGAWVIAEVVGMGLGALVGEPLDLLGLFLVGACLPGAGMGWLLNRDSTLTMR